MLVSKFIERLERVKALVGDVDVCAVNEVNGLFFFDYAVKPEAIIADDMDGNEAPICAILPEELQDDNGPNLRLVE